MIEVFFEVASLLCCETGNVAPDRLRYLENLKYVSKLLIEFTNHRNTSIPHEMLKESTQMAFEEFHCLFREFC